MQVGYAKTRFWTNIWLRCIRVLNRTNREVWKIKPRRTAARVEPSTHGGVRRPLFAQDDDVSACNGLDVIRRRRMSNPPDTTPLVINPFSAAVGHCRTEPGWYFCWKLTLTRTPDTIRPTRRVLTPTEPRTAENKGGYDLAVFVRGGGRTLPETIGDSKTEFNRILCTSKSEAAVTSNKKSAL